MTNDITCEVNFPEEKLSLIDDYVTFIVTKLRIKKVPHIFIQDGKKDNITTTALYSYGTDGSDIRVNGQNRAVVDILRSISHEMIHHAQFENGMIGDEKPPDIGGKIEDQANAYAGRLLKMYSKEKSNLIYEQEEEFPEYSDTPNPIEEKIDKTLQKLAEKIWGYWSRTKRINFNDLRHFNIKKLTGDQRAVFTNYFIGQMLKVLPELEIQKRTSTLFTHLPEYFVSDINVVRVLLGDKFALHSKDDMVPYEDYMFNALSEPALKLLRVYTKSEHINSDLLEEEYPDLCYDIAMAYSEAHMAAQNSHLFKIIINHIKEIFPNAVINFDARQIVYTTKFNDLINIQQFIDSLKHVAHSEIMDTFGIFNKSWVTNNNLFFDKVLEVYHSTVKPSERLELEGKYIPVIQFREKMKHGGYTSHIDQGFFDELSQGTIIDFFGV